MRGSAGEGANCSYTASDGKSCSRPVIGTAAYCALHYGCDQKAGDDLPENPDFEPAFAAVIAAENGDWRGFVFPRGVKFPKQINFPIVAHGSRFNTLDLDTVVFKGPVDFKTAVFQDGAAFRSVTFEDTVTFERSRFDGPVDFLNVQCEKFASFSRADFSGRSILRINFQGSANFNQAVFREGVNFTGWRNVTGTLNAAIELNVFGAATISTGKRQTIRERIRKSVTAARTWIRIKGVRVTFNRNYFLFINHYSPFFTPITISTTPRQTI